jgi:hypothetical protein
VKEGLPYLLEADFQASFEAVQGVKKKQVGTDHLKKGVARSDKKGKNKKAEESSDQQDEEAGCI